MSIPHAYPGMPIDLRYAEETLSEARTTALVKTEEFEAIRMVIPEGHEVCRNHQVNGALTLHCLEGRLSFTADGETRPLQAGQWLFLPARVPHSIAGATDSLALLTVMFH